MNTTRIIATTALLLVAWGAVAGAQNRDVAVTNPYSESYLLYCRGGGFTMDLAIIGDNRGPTGSEHATGLFRFRRGERAASARGETLQPGTCAWIDRGMLPSEPAVIYFDDVTYRIFATLGSGRI